MPRCINCASFEKGCYYTSHETTPRGKGYSAKHEREGKKMKGRDGKMYMVVKVGDGKKRWKKVVSRQTSPRSYFSAQNTNSDFFYRYARFTIYCEIDENDVQIKYIAKAPFGSRVSLDELDENLKEKIINDLSLRIKSDHISRKKKNALRQLRTEIRKSV
jgi:predicted NodU family carbamoyl transferase